MERRGKQQRLTAGDGEDTAPINQLPDEILSSIISYLPFNEAVAVGLVCRRWRNLWHWINRFELTDQSIMSYADARRLASSSTLFSSQIKSCKIGEVSSMQTWINFLVDCKGLEDMCLIGNENGRVFLPPIFGFNRSKLSKLKLINYNVKKRKLFFPEFVNLRTLELEDVDLDVEGVAVESILTSCRKLEKLVLKITNKPDKSSISDQGRSIRNQEKVKVELAKLNICPHKPSNGDADTDSLKVLEIEGMSFSELHIQGGAMRSIRLRGVTCEELSIKCPNVEELSIRDHENYVQTRDVLERCSGILRGTGIEYHISPTYMENLRVLSTKMDLNNNRYMIVLAYALRAWRFLENLYITNQVDPELSPYKLPYHERKFWEMREVVNYSAYNLRRVQIRGFSGTESEISFTSHLVKYATRLRELVIEFDYGCSASRMQSLLSMQKASPDACIIFRRRQ